MAMRVFDEIFNQGKFEVADEIYAPDFQNHGLHQTVDRTAAGTIPTWGKIQRGAASVEIKQELGWSCYGATECNERRTIEIKDWLFQRRHAMSG